MNQQSEMVLEIIARITRIAEAPCKKKIQKMIYLIEEKNITLGFDYKIHIYGPYSADLDYTICELKANCYLDISYGNRGHILQCIEQDNLPPLPDEITKIIDKLGKKNAKELELIATTLYAERYVKCKNKENIINAVKKIKGEKFPDKKIVDAICLLEKMNYFSLGY